MSAPALFPDRALDQALDVAHAHVEAGKARYRPVKTFILFSGGNDSIVLLDALWEHADAIVHVNTGIGVPAVESFAADVAGRYDLPYHVLTPPRSYEDLVLNEKVFDGVPGPGIHHIVYQRLKERSLRKLDVIFDRASDELFLYLTGVRKAESKRRMGYKSALNRAVNKRTRKEYGPAWCNPLLDWSNAEMTHYRTLHPDLPRSEVADNLHMSGECLCGAMADQDGARAERAALAFFYPEVDARLSALEAECVAQGKRYCEWGVKREGVRQPDQDELPLFMCAGCEGA